MLASQLKAEEFTLTAVKLRLCTTGFLVKALIARYEFFATLTHTILQLSFLAKQADWDLTEFWFLVVTAIEVPK